MFARREPSLWRDQRGSALIEGAVVMPLLIALVFGVLEFSWLFYQQHLVTIGLHDAADFLARSSDPMQPSFARLEARRRACKKSRNPRLAQRRCGARPWMDCPDGDD